MPSVHIQVQENELLAIDSTVSHFVAPVIQSRKAKDDLLTSSDINPDETKRLNDTIKKLLGSLPELLSKAPQPIVAAGLILNAIGPIILDIALSYGSGSILSIILKKENLGNIWAALNGVLGSYFLFNTARVFKKADDAAHGKSEDLAVKKSCDSQLNGLEQELIAAKQQSLVLLGKLALSQEQLACSLKENQDNQRVIKKLLEILADNSHISEQEIRCLLETQQGVDRLKSSPKEIAVEKISKIERPVVSTTPLFQTCLGSSAPDLSQSNDKTLEDKVDEKAGSSHSPRSPRSPCSLRVVG